LRDHQTNIVLIGYRCSGKTAVGKILAGELKRDFLDTDAVIEETAHQPIETIISRSGWDHFRELERMVIQDISKKRLLVIATGGGVVTQEENMKNLKRNGWIVWLNGSPEVLKARMAEEQGSGKMRPSLTGKDPLEEIRHVLDVREVVDVVIKGLPKGLQE